MQFAKLTSDVFEGARVSHSLFRQRFQPFDFEFECGYFCFNFLLSVVLMMYSNQLQSLPRNSSKRFAFPLRYDLGDQNAFDFAATRSAARTCRGVVAVARHLGDGWEFAGLPGPGARIRRFAAVRLQCEPLNAIFARIREASPSPT